MIRLNIYNETKEDLKELEQVLKDVFSNIDDKNSLSIILTLDKRIQKLNKTYRHIDKVTDVLSFSSDEENYYGDVFIAINQARKQADRYEHSLKREISFLAVHGYLHLKGYNHQKKEDEKIMNDLTEKILNKANIKRSKDE